MDLLHNGSSDDIKYPNINTSSLGFEAPHAAKTPYVLLRHPHSGAAENLSV